MFFVFGLAHLFLYGLLKDFLSVWFGQGPKIRGDDKVYQFPSGVKTQIRQRLAGVFLSYISQQGGVDLDGCVSSCPWLLSSIQV